MKTACKVKWLQCLCAGLILSLLWSSDSLAGNEQIDIFAPPPANLRPDFDQKAENAKSKDKTIDAIDYGILNVDKLLERLIQPGLLRSPLSRSVEMTLLGEKVLLVQKHVGESSRRDTYEWVGYIQGERHSSSVEFRVAKTVDPDTNNRGVVGLVRRRAKSGEVTYLIIPDERGTHSVVRYLSGNFPPELPPRRPAAGVEGGARGRMERGIVDPKSAKPRPLALRLPLGELQLRPRGNPLIPDFGLPTVEDTLERIRSTRFPELPTTRPPFNIFLPRIDVMVLYTPAAAGILSPWIMWSLIDMTLQNTEDSLNQSGIPVRLNLVDWGRVNHIESNTGSEANDLGQDLTDLEGGVGFNSVRNRRACIKADVVALWIRGCQDCQYCGFSTLNDPINLGSGANPGSEDTAFQVVRWDCALSDHSLAHELGHTMGARHDRGASDTNAIGLGGGYNFGHLNDQTSYTRLDGSRYYEGTIMAERAFDNSVERLDYWSNPNSPHYSDGSMMGVAPPTDPNAADNRRALNANIPLVAKFGENLPPPTEPCGDPPPPAAPSNLRIR